MDIDISGIDKAELLAALYNNTRPQGLGALHAKPGDMGTVEAQIVLSTLRSGDPVVWVDYVYGRPIKVGFEEDTLRRADLYDRDAPDGRGTAQRIVDELRSAASQRTPPEASSP